MLTVDSSRLVTPHQLLFKTGNQANGKDLYYVSLSGVFIIDFIGGERSRSDWFRDKVTMKIPVALDFPPVSGSPSGYSPGYFYTPSFTLNQWTIYVGLNAIFNQNQAVNDGHAVDAFRISPDAGSPPHIAKLDSRSELIIEADIAICDIDAITYRIGYQINLLGYFDKTPAFRHTGN